ncbi:MAG: hypothetical protein AAF573_08395 [Bacteroidota bacterium]
MNVKGLIFQMLTILIMVTSCADSATQSQNEGKTSETKIVDASNLKTGWYYMRNQEDEQTVKMPLMGTTETYLIDPDPIVTTQHVEEASISETFNIKGIKIQLNDKGKERWSAATAAHTNQYFGVVMNGQLINRMRIAAQDNFGNASFALHKVEEDRLHEVVAAFKE